MEIKIPFIDSRVYHLFFIHIYLFIVFISQFFI